VQKTISHQNGFWYGNKAEGQTLKHVVIYLPSSVLPQGQLFVIINPSSSFYSDGVANIEDYRQRIENVSLITTPYVEKYCEFYKEYTNIS